ncbi:rab-GTPase-TBC domain-containing protein [Gorgonomyces haynaldii]|nr:rab-GTPase-TBC domain-containing protein [Gorgonomyces haynaldii]
MLLLRTRDFDLKKWTQNELTENERHQISVDVQRAFVQFYKKDAIDYERKRSSLEYMITQTCSRFPQLHYYQGFHDICTVFLNVVGMEKGLQCVVGASLFWLRDFMEPRLEQTMQHLDIVMELVERANKRLGAHLKRIPDFQPIFCLSWIITWFSHNLDDLDTVYRCFDCILSTDPLFPVYMAASIVLEASSAILSLDSDLSSVHGYLSTMDLNDIDMEHILSQSLDLRDRFPYHTLKTSLEERSCVPRFKGHFLYSLDLEKEMDFNLLPLTIQTKQQSLTLLFSVYSLTFALFYVINASF